MRIGTFGPHLLTNRMDLFPPVTVVLGARSPEKLIRMFLSLQGSLEAHPLAPHSLFTHYLTIIEVC